MGIDNKSWWLPSRRSALALALVDAFENHVVFFTVNSYPLQSQSHLFGLPHGPTIEDRVVVDKDTSTPCDYPNLTA